MSLEKIITVRAAEPEEEEVILFELNSFTLSVLSSEFSLCLISRRRKH